MRTSDLKEALLVAIFREASKSDLGGFIDPKKVADAAGLPRAVGQLRLALKSMESLGLIKLTESIASGDEDGMRVRLAPHGLEEAEAMDDEFDDFEPSSAAIAESQDSVAQVYVSAAPIREAAVADIGKLAQSIAGSNSADPEDRQIALAELAVMEAALAQPVIATSLIERFVKGIMKWIAAKFADGAIQAVVAAIILHLAPFLQAN